MEAGWSEVKRRRERFVFLAPPHSYRVSFFSIQLQQLFIIFLPSLSSVLFLLLPKSGSAIRPLLSLSAHRTLGVITSRRFLSFSLFSSCFQLLCVLSAFPAGKLCLKIDHLTIHQFYFSPCTRALHTHKALCTPSTTTLRHFSSYLRRT